MKELIKYAAYLLEHQLETIATIHLGRARAVNLDLLQAFAHWKEEQLMAYLKKNYQELLISIQNGQAYEHVLQTIALWRDNQYPGISHDQPGLHDLVQSVSIRKYSFMQLLPTYTQDLAQGLAIVQELNEYCDFYREKAYECYIDIQHEAIIREKDLVNTILDVTPEGIYALDQNLKVTLWNQALSSRQGIEKGEILGRSITDYFPDMKESRLLEAIGRAQKGEHIQLKSKTEEKYYEINIVPLHDPKGHIIGSLTLSRDVTEHKLAVDELAAANEELSSQQEELYAINATLEEKIQELESTQKALQQSQHFIESVVHTSPDYITVYHLKERKNVYANKGVAEFLGYDEHEARVGGFAFLQTVVHPADIPKIQTFITEYLTYTGNAARELEYRIKNKAGAYRWISTSYNVFSRDEKGLPVEVVGVSKDITERKQQSEELQRALNYYLTILDDFPALIWRSNTEAQCDYFNKTWLNFTGRTLEQELGEGWSEGIHPDDVQRCLDTYLTSFHAQSAFEMEYRLRRHDGQYRWLLDIAKPVYGLKGEFTGFLGVCFDIQERKDAEKLIHDANHELAAALEELTAAEEQLRETNTELERRVEQRTTELAASAEQLRLITDALPVLISYVNAAQEFVFVNKAYTTWFGKSKEEILGKPAWEIIGQTAYEKVRDVVLKALAGEEVRYEGYMPYRFGGAREVVSHFVPHTVDGKVEGFFTLITDVSTLKKAQAELSKRNQELIKINSDLDNFIYTASHDLKAPIANIEGLMQALMRNYSREMQNSQQVQRITAMIAESVERFKKTIHHLTEVSKLQKENEHQVVQVDLLEVVQEVMLDLASLIREADADITIDIEPGLSVQFSQKNLRSIVYNLLSNAIKYRSPDRQLIVHIYGQSQSEHVVFTVQDNGLGIDAASQKKLFSMFKRFHTHVEGSGIGLYMVKKIIDNSGSHIDVVSEAGKGSVFTVYFRQ